MATNAKAQSQSRTPIESFLARVLDPVDRLVEAIYSVLIVLTFTLAVKVIDAQAAGGDGVASAMVRQLFLAAFGCAVAWGLIDGAMYVLSAMFTRGEQLRLLGSIRQAASEEEGVAILAGKLDAELEPLADAAQRQHLYSALYHRLRDSHPQPAGFKREDFGGALGVVVVAITSALPIVAPLLLFAGSPALALRLSNLVAFAMLFWMGYRWAKHVGSQPWKTGLYLLLIGLVMVVVAIPLGG